jgi:hypothetical protein
MNLASWSSGARAYGRGPDTFYPVSRETSSERVLVIGEVPAVACRFVTTRAATLFCGAEAYEINTIFLQHIGHGLQLERSLPVTVQRADGRVVAFSYDLDEMGYGETDSEALEDLRGAIAESYFLLRDAPKLGPLQQRHRDFLCEVVREG